jgi:hypothetical protein
VPSFFRIMRAARGATSMKRGRSALAPLSCALAGAITLAATSAGAEPLPCRDDYALFRGTTNVTYDIEVVWSPCGATINRPVALKYRGKAVGVRPSNDGFARFMIIHPTRCERFRELFEELAKHPDTPSPHAWTFLPCSSGDADAAVKPAPQEPGEQLQDPTLWWRYEKDPASLRLQ